MALPSLTIGGPYLVMKHTATYISEYTGIQILHPYFLVAIPRLMMTVLSFVSDVFIYKICVNYDLRPWTTLKIWSSSYVVQVYLTRTFSNSYEVVLFTLLLYLVSDAMKLTERHVRHEVELLNQYRNTSYAVERARIYKQQKEIPRHKYNHCVWIGGLFAVGVFNRPTFVLYAMVPLFFWMQRGMFLKRVGLTEFHHRMFSLAPSFTLVSLLLIVGDSLFYGTVRTLASFGTLSVSNLVITPINFVAYNMDTANLVRHGLHPWYLHALVHLPLLFNVLGLAGLWLLSRAVVLLVSSGAVQLFDLNGLLVLSFGVPLLTLSWSPHQEARFLLPLLVPLVLLLAPTLARTRGAHGRCLRSVWYAANVACALFFGFFHQAGLYDVQHFMHGHLQQRHAATRTHVLYAHTYMPPVSLLTVDAQRRPLSGAKYRRSQTVFVEDLAGLQLPDLVSRFSQLGEDARLQWHAKRLNSEIFAVLPATFGRRLESALLHHPTLKLDLVHRSFPHLSMEDPPYLGDLCGQSSSPGDEWCQPLLPWLMEKGSQLSLNVYRLSFALR